MRILLILNIVFILSGIIVLSYQGESFYIDNVTHVTELTGIMS